MDKEVDMTSRKSRPAGELSSALGLGLNFLRQLEAAVLQAGGDPEIVAWCTKECFKGNLLHVAKTMVDCDWRIPASRMQSRALSASGLQIDHGDRDFVRKYWWYAECQMLGIPVKVFRDDPSDGTVIPPLIREALHGKKLEYPMYLDDKHVIVDIDFKRARRLLRWFDSKIIDGRELDVVGFVDCRYFDFDR
jgi:hypothetical protein